MEDSIYALLVIGWIVFGVIKAVSKNKNNKPKTNHHRPTDATNTQQNQKSPTEDFLNTLFSSYMTKEGENEHPYTSSIDDVVVEKAINPMNITTGEKLDSYQGSDNINSVFKHKNEISQRASNSDEEFDNQSSDNDDSQSQTEFNLREAIIHQVILERPY